MHKTLTYGNDFTLHTLSLSLLFSHKHRHKTNSYILFANTLLLSYSFFSFPQILPNTRPSSSNMTAEPIPSPSCRTSSLSLCLSLSPAVSSPPLLPDSLFLILSLLSSLFFLSLLSASEVVLRRCSRKRLLLASPAPRGY